MVNPETFLITNEYVRQALNYLVQSTAIERINPLQYLQIVEAYMLTSDFTFFPHPRQFALNDLLSSVIKDQYDHQRDLHSLPSVKRGINLKAAFVVIKGDAVVGVPDLIGWSWLYFHYVEINLHVSQQLFCETVNFDDRTIRRYQNDTIDQLTKHLIRMEQESREFRHKHILYLQLPHQGNVSDLIERDQGLEQLRSSKSKHFQIVGAPGIGKTEFTEYFLQELIGNNELHQIIWFKSPKTIENVKSYLQERLLVENTNITIAEYISIRKVAIVIDGSENLQKDLIALQEFLQNFSNAYIFLISHFVYPLSNCLQVNLREISLSASQEMLRILNPKYKEFSESIDYTRTIWPSIGGNPLAIKLLSQNWSVLDIQSATLMTLDQIFSKVYSSLIPSERLAWLILALLNNSSLTFIDVAEIDSPHVDMDDFVMLSRLCITTTHFDNPNIGLTHSAYRYIQYKYESSLELQSAFSMFMKHTNWNAEKYSELILVLVESVLLTDWIDIDPDYLLEATHKFWEVGLLKGHYTKWYSILSKYQSKLKFDNLDLVRGYGICQRYLGQWAQSYAVFMSVVEYAGHHGEFLFQAKALVDLAILLRYQGEYENALRTLNHINTLPSATLDDNTRNRFTIEHIELALESNALIDARILLKNLPAYEPRKDILQIEIYAKEPTLSINMAIVTSLADNLLFNFAHSPSIVSRVHILVGRILERNSDIESAIKHLSIALSLLLEQDNDPFALARTQSNLAGLFINNNQLSEARKLLNSAEYIQRQIRDRVGLAVTMHNKHVVDRKIVN